MAALEIRLFGTLELRFNGEPWTFTAPPRATSLLAYMLVHVGEPISRAALANLTWPDDAEDEARGKLRRHLHRIVRALPEPPDPARPWIDVTASTIRWLPSDDVWVDAHEFERAAGEPSTFGRAVELYRGEFLEGYFEDWVLLERERCQSRFLEVCYDAALAARRERTFDAAVRYADRMLAVDEWREDALRLSMTARYEAGDRSAALASFEKFSARLRSEMRVEPMPETLALRTAIMANAPVPGQADTLMDRPGGDAKSPFVGRTEEQRALNASWLRAARGRGTTIFVGGVAGIGKSRLVAEISAQVDAQGGRTLFGRTSNPEAFPYESVVDALRRSFPLIVESRVDAIWLASLAQLLPELRGAVADLPEAPPLSPDRSRARLFEAIARTVEQLARSRPLLVVLEDVHWAQATTLEAIETLARRLGALPVLFVLTYRTEEAGTDHPLSALRRTLQSERRASSITLHGLARDDIARLVEMQGAFASAPPELADSVYALSEGNPLFASQLLGSYAETGTVPDAGSAARSVGQTILARVELLGQAERALAETAATIGRYFTVETLSRVLGWSEAEVFDSLGTLLDRGLVRETGDTAFSYAFSHSLIATAIYGASDVRRQALRHRRIAAVLSQTLGSDRQELAIVARHWRVGGKLSEAAEKYAQASAAALAVHARGEAIDYAREAIALATDPRKRYDALLVLSRAATGHAEHGLWKNALEEMDRLVRDDGDDLRRYCVLEQWETYYSQIGDRARQRETIEAMLAGRGEAAENRRAGALCSLGMLEFLAGELRQARAVLREALRSAFSQADRATAALARQRLVQVQIRLGLMDEARHHIEAMRADWQTVPSLDNRRYLAYAEATLALELEDAAGFERAGREMLEVARAAGDLEDEARAHALLALAASKRHDATQVREHFQIAAEKCERLGQQLMLASIYVYWGGVETEAGRAADGRRYLERASAITLGLGSKLMEGYCAVLAARVAKVAGNPSGSLEPALRAYELAAATGELKLRIVANMTLGEAECAAGNVDRGLALMQEAIDLRRTQLATEPLVEDLGTYASALLDAGRNAEAIAVANELRVLCGTEIETRGNPAQTYVVLARAAQAAGDAAEGASLRLRGRAYAERRLAALEEDDRAALRAQPAIRELFETPDGPTVAGRATRRETRTVLHNS